jgi:Skp family chaperone for outer membrane proteins
VKKTIIAGLAAATLCGAFVCLPIVRGQNGPTAGRAAKSQAKSSPGAAAGSSGTLKIACFDMGLILREYRKVADKRRETAAIAEVGNAKIRQLQGEGQALLKRVQDEKLEQDSDEFRAREKKAFQIENAIKACKAAAERDMKLQSVKIAAAIYEDVQAALKRFTEQNGYTLVIQIDREADQTQDYRMMQKVTGQLVIYHRNQEDITVAVLSHLNNRYEAERAEAGIDDGSSPDQSGDEQPKRTIPVSPNRKRATP